MLFVIRVEAVRHDKAEAMIAARAVILLTLLALAVCAGPAWSREVAIGVLAFRGADNCLKRWGPTARYLGTAVADHSFRIVPLSLEEMSSAAAQGDVDFILTNTGNYVELEARYGISRIATLRAPGDVTAGNIFGAVIFTRADRRGLRTLEDLKGKRFMAVKPHGFGGFQMAWRELKDNGIDPFADFSSLTFSGFPQDKVAAAVRDGVVDAGTFRTGSLESLAAEGKIDLADFQVLNRKIYAGFPFAVSTRLYPEWPFSKLRATPQDVSQKVAVALLSMPADSPAAQAGSYGGWTVPLDYQPVHELFRELRIGPYEDLGAITMSDIFKQYGPWMVLVVLVLVLTVSWAAWIEFLVTRRTRELSLANKELERQVAERQRVEEVARQRQAELAHVARLNTMGEMASG
ncbi:MAG: PhnD/SsuA/transferrin family substrate-binding protein, partial [Alphaproteobacteria bacterium]|nr:PhnD/SsuA/transferrin family substrate-binding protein [Alphaproteobacteria bacterium]